MHIHSYKRIFLAPTQRSREWFQTLMLTRIFAIPSSIQVDTNNLYVDTFKHWTTAATCLWFLQEFKSGLDVLTRNAPGDSDFCAQVRHEANLAGAREPRLRNRCIYAGWKGHNAIGKTNTVLHHHFLKTLNRNNLCHETTSGTLLASSITICLEFG